MQNVNESPQVTTGTASSPQVNFSAIPDELKARRQWVLWKWEDQGGRITKPPFMPNGKYAVSTDPDTWNDFETVVKDYEKGGFNGIGYVFSKNDPYIGIDFDSCRDPKTGRFDSWAWEQITLLKSYTEISPSGKGAKTIVKGKMPNDEGKRNDEYCSGGLEMYSQGRYFCLTGLHVKGTPPLIIQNQTAIDAIYKMAFEDNHLPEALAQEEGATGKTLDDLTEKQRKIFLDCVEVSSLADVGFRSDADWKTVIWGIKIGLDKEEIWRHLEGVGKTRVKGKNGRKYFETTYKNALSKVEAKRKQKNGTPAARETGVRDNAPKLQGTEKGKGKIPEAGVFWEYVTVNAKGDLKLIINRSRFIEFLQTNGFYKTELNDKDYIFVRVDKNIVTEVRPVHIKNFVKQYIQSLKIPEAPEIETAILKGARQYFATDLIEFLDNIKITFNRPDKKTAFFYYRNCVAKVTGEKGIEVIQYSDLPGKVWKNQILDRDFKVIDFDGCEYERFINNVSGQAGQDKQPDRKDAFTSAIGYLLHGFKHKPIAKAVICVDERIPRNDNEANGGTGKGIFFNAIAKLKNSVIKDGQTFKSDKTFLYQDVNLDTEILIIDDAKKSFPFHAVFSTITEDMPVEKKNRPLFIIPFERSPKMIITTNFTITGRGTSYERRKFEIEFADYYKANFTPYDEFKHTLFDDWSAEEWLKFDNFMLTCCWLYLKDGLIEYSRRNVAERTLIDDTHRDFVEFAKESLETGSFDRNELYDKFRKQYTDFNNDKFTTNTFRKWLTYYADFKNWHADFKRSNSKNYVAFTKKLPFPPGSA